MLDELTPSQLKEVRAAYRVLPLDDGWEQAGTIAAAIHNEFERYMAGKAGKRSVDKKSWRKPGDYIPRIQQKKPPKVNQASIDTYEQMIASQYARG